MHEPDRIIRLKTVLARTGPADGEHVAPLDPGGDKYENPMTKDSPLVPAQTTASLRRAAKR
jgi:hypothetical protein